MEESRGLVEGGQAGNRRYGGCPHHYHIRIIASANLKSTGGCMNVPARQIVRDYAIRKNYKMQKKMVEC